MLKIISQNFSQSLAKTLFSYTNFAQLQYSAHYLCYRFKPVLQVTMSSNTGLNVESLGTHSGIVDMDCALNPF